MRGPFGGGALLIAQNLTIFWAHYFRGAGIPWDFSLSYFGMVAFWTSVVRDGVFPQWIPFQQMGYPFALQAQSGFNYPPLWLFPALDIPYTLRAAVAFQCAHVLLGAFGMFLLGHAVHASRALALVGAIAFQCFGGFFSNAEHPDIVRAYALAPWLLYVFSLEWDGAHALPRRAWLIPGVLWLFLTGVYPGNVISGAVIVVLYLSLQVVDGARRGTSAARLARTAVATASLGALGLGMAAVHLGPLWLFRSDFVRADASLAFNRFGLWVEHLPGLFLSNASLRGEISMTSTYVSLPILILACFTPWAALARHWVWLGITGVATALATGDHTALGSLLRGAVPVLGLSRFPSSDYRGFVALGLVLFALAGLRALSEGRLSRRRVMGALVLCTVWILAGLRAVHEAVTADAIATVAIAAIVFAVAVAAMSTSGRYRTAFVGASIALIGADAIRVLPTLPGWYEPSMEAYYPYQGSPPYTRNRGRRLASSYIVANMPATRPARDDSQALNRWSGYITGGFYARDLTPNVLRASALVVRDDRYQRFMLREWTPILLPPDLAAENRRNAALTDDDLNAVLVERGDEPLGSVRQTHYGINEVTYRVALAEERLLVENEMYFPGWRARLELHSTPELEAIPVNGVFRGWCLPAGTYTFTASFQFPRLMLFRAIGVAALLLWIAGWAASRRATQKQSCHPGIL